MVSRPKILQRNAFDSLSSGTFVDFFLFSKLPNEGFFYLNLNLYIPVDHHNFTPAVTQKHSINLEYGVFSLHAIN